MLIYHKFSDKISKVNYDPLKGWLKNACLEGKLLHTYFGMKFAHAFVNI
ncbi:hypothetical protein D1BOALGB6SA_9517 [Olavius sp. associated proteobacterium Delta 1]|nr:hypothetical protein D1BOALGB6SA_9517 [Olavius sp. associated proteobacterium Delta 1]